MLTYPSAITGSSRMLPLLLLPLFIASLASSKATGCLSKTEFRINLDVLNNSVQNCPDNCSSAHITDTACQCLNLNTSLEECGSRGFAIKALKSLHTSNSTEKPIEHLIKVLKRMEQRNCTMKIDLCALSGKVSPKKLHEKLASWLEQFSSKQ